eukprot:TRINITY_DN7775_c0_g1_i1.p1 TRINITY_DN7775_c0_g1~~TRINITY_DN7775_c0_g1_i1.p1  ORF type:complete len:476 (-),score=175.31 TRINITY_DN7775_c0_g1_i1:51-1478(-)
MDSSDDSEMGDVLEGMNEEDHNSNTDDSKVQIKFITKLADEFKVTETPFEVTSKLSRYGLSEIINHLLSLDPPKPFDFLINGELLRITLSQWVKKYGEKSTIIIEYVPALTKPEISEELQHDDWISCIDSCDGYILTGSYDKKVRVWNESRELVYTFTAHDNIITNLRVCRHPEEQVLEILTSSKDQTLKNFKIDLSAKKHSLLTTFEGHDSSVSSFDFIKDRDSSNVIDIVSSSWDNSVLLWISDLQQTSSSSSNETDEKSSKNKKSKRKIEEISTKVVVNSTVKKPDFHFSGHKQKVSAVKWLDHEKIVSGSNDNTIKIWDAASGINIHTLQGNRAVTCLDVSDENNFILSGNNDNRLRLWDCRTSENQMIKRTYKSHKGWISSVSLHPTNKNYFISSSHDKTVKLWDIRSSVPLFSLPESVDKVLTSVWGNKESDDGDDNNQLILYGGADTKLTISLALSSLRDLPITLGLT